MIEKYNLFEKIEPNIEKELFYTIFQNSKIRVEKIVSYGQTSPDGFWYSQNESEYVVLLDGYAILEFIENDNAYEIELHRGDTLNIEPHQKHRVKYTATDEATIWLAVFY